MQAIDYSSSDLIKTPASFVAEVPIYLSYW
jgi:hypothetical protein